MRISVLFLFLLWVIFAFAQEKDATKPDLKGKITWEKVDVKGRQTVSGDSSSVLPGDVVRYHLTYTNAGKDTATDVELVDPIPDGTIYVEGTASAPDAVVLFSVDGGKTFHTPPVKYIPEGKKVEKEATVDMFTHIKWVLERALAPGASVTAQFDVRIKESEKVGGAK